MAAPSQSIFGFITADGVPGPRGPRGLDGPNGLQGPTGPTGTLGETTEYGATGPTGPAEGPKGAMGPTGPTGVYGHTGATGTIGGVSFTTPAWQFLYPDTISAPQASALLSTGALGPMQYSATDMVCTGILNAAGLLLVYPQYIGDLPPYEGVVCGLGISPMWNGSYTATASFGRTMNSQPDSMIVGSLVCSSSLPITVSFIGTQSNTITTRGVRYIPGQNELILNNATSQPVGTTAGMSFTIEVGSRSVIMTATFGSEQTTTLFLYLDDDPYYIQIISTGITGMQASSFWYTCDRVV